MFEKCYIIIYLLDCLSGIQISTKSIVRARSEHYLCFCSDSAQKCHNLNNSCVFVQIIPNGA